MKKLLLLLTLSFFSIQGFAAGCPDGSEPAKTVSADGSYYEYKCAIEETLPDIADEITVPGYVIVLKEDFSKGLKYKKNKKNLKNYEYYLPHDHDTTKKAMTIKDGVMTMKLEPGMRGWGGDKNNATERAEIGMIIIDGDKLIPRDKLIKIKFDFKLPKEFTLDSFRKEYLNWWTLISQVKHDGKSKYNPQFSVYSTERGVGKCVDYNNSKDQGKHIQNHVPLKSYSKINIYDNKWHTFEIYFKLGKDDGYCQIKLDEEIIIEKENYDNDIHPERPVVARFGIYRYEADFIQIVHYDNIEIGYYN